jgi:hypothetical protein
MKSGLRWQLRLLLCTLLLGVSLLGGALQPAWAAPTAEAARLGMYMKIARDLNRSDVRAALEVWTEELMRKFHVPSEVRFYSDIAVLRHDFDTGEVNLVIADAMTFVRHFKPEELASGFTAKLPSSASLLLLGRPNGGGLAQLAGKRIARLEDDEVSSTYLETLCLKRIGKVCAEVPVTMVPVPNNHQAVSRLLFNQVDFALVNQHGYETAIELNPQLRKAGELVEKLSFETQFFGFFNSKVSPEFQRFALRTIDTMHLEPRGRQMLDVFKTDRVTKAEPIVLKPFYQLEREYRELRTEARRKERKP